MGNLKINFVPINEYIGKVSPPPKPARKYFPDFLKKMPPYAPNMHGKEIETATRCAPFTDSFVSGYMQELHCDIEIKNNGKENGEDLIIYTWADNRFRPINTRAEENYAVNLFPHFEKYYHAEFHWTSPWEPQTPKGWSMMYHHPSNRPDLPFYTFTGIVDTDGWTSHGPVPFLIKEGFEGIIPAGTPIYQMTPIKREDWTSKAMEYDEEFQESMKYKLRKKFGGYRKLIWNKKSFL